MPHEALAAEVDALCARIAANGPSAVAAAKELVRDVARAPIDDALVAETARRIAAIRVAPEGREGIASFLEKRKPGWAPP